MKFKKELPLLITGSLLFNFLFWQETFGVNVLLFTIFIILSIHLLFPSYKKSPAALTTLIGVITTAAFVVAHGSTYTVVKYWISLAIMIGFIHQHEIRSIVYAIPTALSNYFRFLPELANDLNSKGQPLNKLTGVVRFLRIVVVPILFLTIFYFLFKFANPVFDKLSMRMIGKISDWFSVIFYTFSFNRFLFFVSGIFLIGGIIYNTNIRSFLKEELSLNDFILRNKTRPRKIANIQVFPLTLGLKKEAFAALFLMISINLLLLLVNITDIISVWLFFEYKKSMSLKLFVHEGTYLLILSILLSIGIMLFYFRKNLNFHPQKKVLRVLATIWILQNVVLLISVAIRNYHYIHYFGLAYKRIGVILFLMLVLVGLFTLYLKITKLKSAYYLFRINSWAMYLVVTCASFVNWDGVITDYNLSHPLKENMETSFLLTLSDKILPKIDQRKDILDQPTELNTYASFGSLSYHEVYDLRIKNFMERKKGTTWLSWNWEESKALAYFLERKKMD